MDARIALALVLIAGPVLPAEDGARPGGKGSLTIPVGPARTGGRPGASCECVVRFGPAVPVAAVAFAPGGKTLASGGYREVLVWDLSRATLLERRGTGALSDVVRALAFSPDGSLLAAGEGSPGRSGVVRIFDLAGGGAMASLEEPKDSVHALAFSPDGTLLAAGGADPVVRIYSIWDKKVVAEIKDHSERVTGLSFRFDGKLLATSSADRTARVFEVETWKQALAIRQAEPVHGVAFSPDGKLLAFAAGGQAERAVRIRKMDDGEPPNAAEAGKGKKKTAPGATRTLDTGAGIPLDAVWAPKGDRVFAPTTDGTVKVFDPVRGTLVSSLAGHGDWVHCLAASSDGERIASGSADGTVKLWSAGQGRLIATLMQLSPFSDEWLIIAAEGPFATSSPGSLRWRSSDPKSTPEDLVRRYQDPRKLREAMDRSDPPPPAPREKSEKRR